MKLLLTFLIAYFSILNADEVQRIDSIVNDISQLRSDYSRVQNSLIEMEVNLEEEKLKNKILHQDLKLYSNYTQKEEDYQNKIKSLENKINNLKKSIKTKQKQKIICKTIPLKTIKTIVLVENTLNNHSSHTQNKFPKLLMKKQYRIADTTKAYAYRVKKEAVIYDGIDGYEIDVWEDLTSFTSNEKTQTWVRITGYFVDKVWRPSRKNMWIKSSDTIKRTK